MIRNEKEIPVRKSTPNPALDLADNIPKAGSDWSLRTDPPQLRRGAAHIWLFNLGLSKEQIDRLAPLLNREELQRSDRFRFACDRNRYIAGRGQLRRLLSLYLKLSPDRVEFSYGPSGKPRLSDSQVSSKIHFNLSHSENIALLGITYNADIGTDIERVRKVADRESVAKFSFAPNEFETLGTLPENDQEEAFFRCWTRKEAFLKALGTGITEGLHEFEVDFRHESKARFLSMRPEFGRPMDWSLQAVPIGNGWCAAVAVHAPQINPHFWRFDNISYPT